ncbi:recombinase family protein [Streptomyces sp. I6]|uniref:recombinase family protein n=1 Tax=Streptomyces sp. I6 TaxID=2483113 RepID=UPI002880163E|nr:recombinase family protein [Streptomyces sp. I6]
MANLVYKRVSTDQQCTARQDLVLAEAGIEDPVVFEEHPGTSSRLHPLQRPKFGELLTYARSGDTVHISEMFRLVRGNQHIPTCSTSCTRAALPAHPRRRVHRHGPHRPPPAHGRAAVHRGVHGADPRRRRRTPA